MPGIAATEPKLNRQIMVEARQVAGLTLTQLAEKIGVKTPTVWRWEQGKASPRASHMKALAKALKLSVASLTN